MRIIRASGKNGEAEIFVDDTDYEQLSVIKWSVRKDGSVISYQRKDGLIKAVHMGRLLVGAKDSSQVVVYKNGNKLDNQRTNLELLRQSDFVRRSLKKRKIGALWTDEQIAILREVIVQKNGVKLAAERLGKSVEMIRWKAKDIGISPQSLLMLFKWTDEADKLVCERYPTEGTTNGLPEELGISRSVVIRRAKQLGIQRNRNGRSNFHFTGFGGISGSYWFTTQQGARRRNIPFEIDIQYAWSIFKEQQGMCALSGAKLIAPESRLKGTASLDRIDSNLGYICGNIQWVHKTVNLMKMNLEECGFIRFCRLVSRHTEDRECP